MMEHWERKPLGKSFCTIEPMTMLALGAGASAGGSIFSGIMGASGAGKNAAAIRYMADKAAETALTMNQRAREDVAPFRGYGIKAGDTLTQLLLGGGGAEGVINQVHASPLFNFQSELGMRNINRELSARGIFNSGAGLETLQRFNNQLVGEEGQRIYDRLFGVTQLGANAAAQQATMTNAVGNSVANMQLQAGIAQGGAVANQYGAIGQGVGGAFNLFGKGLANMGEYSLYAPMINSMAATRGGGDPLFNARDSGSYNYLRPTSNPLSMDMAAFNGFSGRF